MARKRGGGGKGGYQRPSNPAPVSGPGALSARTDGGVPKALPTGGDYGDRKALAEQQSAAPMDPRQDATGGGAQAAGRPVPGSQFGGSAFSPTQRPGEPMTAGVDWGEGPGAQTPLGNPDPLLFLRLLHEKAPSAATARLLARLSRA